MDGKKTHTHTYNISKTLNEPTNIISLVCCRYLVFTYHTKYYLVVVSEYLGVNDIYCKRI